MKNRYLLWLTIGVFAVIGIAGLAQIAISFGLLSYARACYDDGEYVKSWNAYTTHLWMRKNLGIWTSALIQVYGEDQLSSLSSQFVDLQRAAELSVRESSLGAFYLLRYLAPDNLEARRIAKRSSRNDFERAYLMYLEAQSLKTDQPEAYRRQMDAVLEVSPYVIEAYIDLWKHYKRGDDANQMRQILRRLSNLQLPVRVNKRRSGIHLESLFYNPSVLAASHDIYLLMRLKSLAPSAADTLTVRPDGQGGIWVRSGQTVFYLKRARNLVTNASFEFDVAERRLPTGWRDIYQAPGSLHHLKRVSHGDWRGTSQAAGLVHPSKRRTNFASRTAEVAGSALYFLGSWVKTEGTGKAKLGVVWRTDDGTRHIKWVDNVFSPTWVYSARIVEAPAFARQATIWLTNFETDGSAWFDDVLFFKLTPFPF